MTQRVTLSGVLMLELPGRTVRLCDGGTLSFGGGTHKAVDAVFGTVSSYDVITEGVADEAPAGTITFVPQGDAAVDDICSADMQGSRLRIWIAEVDEDDGTITGTPDQILDAVIDVPVLKLGRTKREVEAQFVSTLERLFVINRGNVLSGEFHRKIYPGERGLDNALGVSSTFAWGVASAPRGVTTGSVGGGSGGGRGSIAPMDLAG